MEGAGIIVFLPRESGSETPLLLENLLFSPAALWLTQALSAVGAHRFFVVCHGDDEVRCIPAFPPGTVFVTNGASDAKAQLDRFLSVCKGRVLVFTRPVFLLPEGVRQLEARLPSSFGHTTGVFELTDQVRDTLLNGEADFQPALRSAGEEYRGDGFLPLTAETLGAAAQDCARAASVARLLAQGVRFIDRASCTIDPTVTVGGGTVILPGTILRGNTSIGSHCTLGPNTMIENCAIGTHVTVNASQLLESVVEDGAKIGPFAYIRPHCHVGRDVKVGDFVELKNSVIGDGTKISHLTYVGDSDVGSRVNFGCGTVTVNYDGSTKFRTQIGDGAFIGCNTNLVAPVKIGDRAYTAAGSTITNDVPADSLAIARPPQTIKVQWAAKRRKAMDKK